MALKKQFSKSKPVCKVTFQLPKEAVTGAKEVVVLGDFNNWQVEKGLKMKANKTAFTAAMELPTGCTYQFRYFIDNEKWENDWAADAYVASPYTGIENSLLALPVAETVATITKSTKKKTPTAKKTTTVKKAVTKKAVKATAKKAVAKKVVKATAKKAVAKKATKPATVKADDLKKIEGIGPKIATLLNKAGVVTFADLGKAKVTFLRKVLTDAGSRYTMHDPSTWAKQAKMAAKGNWVALKKWQDELNGGRK